MLEAGIYPAPAELGVGEGQASSWHGCPFSKGFLWGSPACLPSTCVLPGPDVPSREVQRQPCLCRQGHESTAMPERCRLWPMHTGVFLPPDFAAMQQTRQIPMQKVQPGVASSRSPHGWAAALNMAQRPGCQHGYKAATWCCQRRGMASLAVSLTWDGQPHSVPATGCIVHENTWGRLRRTDSLAASGFLPPGHDRRLTSLLPVGMAAPAPLSP